MICHLYIIIKIQMEEKLICYIRNTIFQLACDSNIDHRNYNREPANSRLLNKLKIGTNSEKAIKETVLELLNDVKFNEILKKIQQNKKNNEENDDDEENNDDDDNCNYANDLYYIFDYVGLNIHNLHSDDKSDFENSLLKCFM